MWPIHDFQGVMFLNTTIKPAIFAKFVLQIRPVRVGFALFHEKISDNRGMIVPALGSFVTLNKGNF